MTTQFVEGSVPATTAASSGALTARAASSKAAGLAAIHGAWDFLKAVSEVRIRSDMLATADQIAATRPELAARLRLAARENWAQ